MNNVDPSAAACLRVLLEEQSAQLRSLMGDMAAAVEHGLRVVPPEGWSGPARHAHDELVKKMTAQIHAARSALEQATSDSDHAVLTLAGRG